MEPVDREARERLSRLRRPNFNFVEMGIPEGASIKCVRTGETARVVGPRKVEFRGEECSLTQATRIAHQLDDGYAIAPGPHWTFDGRSLSEIYDDTYDYPDTP
ncbi:MAG: hypothetical protein R3C60_08960 [Parvularculaceae bacterium]